MEDGEVIGHVDSLQQTLLSSSTKKRCALLRALEDRIQNNGEHLN